MVSIVSAGLSVAACNKYYGIDLVVVEHVCVKTEEKGYTVFNVNKRVLQLGKLVDPVIDATVMRSIPTGCFRAITGYLTKKLLTKMSCTYRACSFYALLAILRINSIN